ncbi:M64 family metallopeptidase [Kribbella sp. NBC_01505]|uniref:hypothetical protein n=1 Tax=Kribbella sp. NBC_01505 TaxID=2903580 RepID=UPI0038662694
MVPDLVLFPHCDVHVALTGAKPLTMQVMLRINDSAKPGQYKLVPAIKGGYSFEFFAPHNAVGERFDELPSVDNQTGLVTATTRGVYLFQVRYQGQYQVGRLQVHKELLGWWFGNDSITTALDTQVGHAQPSIYARFTDEPTGTDLVGDITGHGYVELKSTQPDKVSITPTGRLMGLLETPAPTKENPHPPAVPITGTLLGTTRSLDVRVVDYGKVRSNLVSVRSPGGAGRAATQHNLLFLPEGFLETVSHRELFTTIVNRVAWDLSYKPRHEPYGMLKKSISIFSSFAASQQSAITTGYRVTDTAAGPGPGVPIPLATRVPENAASVLYTLKELIALVGLPMRGETRPADVLAIDWSKRDLPAFNLLGVTSPLVAAWRAHQSRGILNARDTAFGMHLGGRLADRISGKESVEDPVVSPGVEVAGSPALRRFIGRLYEFYSMQPTETISLDPRRHPPELHASSAETNSQSAVLRYVGALQDAASPPNQIGQEWIPDNANFKRSRGLVVIISFDDMIGGQNIENSSMVASTLDGHKTLTFQYGGPADPEEMRRDATSIQVNSAHIADTVAHELGHSFNLGDEYEDTGGLGPGAEGTADLGYDNVTVRGIIRTDPPDGQKIDVAKAKWFGLPRIQISATLTAPSVPDGAGIRVTVGPTDIHLWKWAKEHDKKPELRMLRMRPVGPISNRSFQQLPLENADEVRRTGLSIGEIDSGAGSFVLTGPGPTPYPTFPAGSVLFVPLLDGQRRPLTIVERAVTEHINAPGTAGTHRPLNFVAENTVPQIGIDEPEDIPGFTFPTTPATLLGIYEGASHYPGGYYRPAGTCKMRTSGGPDEHGQFCYVCKWLIVNRVDPAYHDILSSKFYPKRPTDG